MRAALGLWLWLGLGFGPGPVAAGGAPQRARTFIIPIEGTPRTVRLRQQAFLPEGFRVYIDGQGGLTEPEPAPVESGLLQAPSNLALNIARDGAAHSQEAQRDCFYEGDIKGFPISHVVLSTCSGLSGILQLANASYGIKPLEAAARNQHLVYPVWSENAEAQLLAEKSSLVWPKEVSPEPEDAVAGKEAASSPLRYLEMHIILDKALYDYMGGDKDVVVTKIVQLFSYVNSMFAPLNLTVVLSSLEFWVEKNRIPTTGDAEELLQSFLQWKNEHRLSWLQDVMFLFVYREQSRYVGASSARKLCLKTHTGGVALHRRAMTLEAFAVAVAQLLGLSLGMELEDPGSCHCAGAACIMQPNSVHSPGVKAFSICSIRDFQRFLAAGEGQCLLKGPAVGAAYKAPKCGNKVVEPGEACDCGTAEECRHDPCCTIGCKLRRGVQCLTGPCCRKCQFRRKGAVCRRSSEDECELKEYCNGTSAQCSPDLWVMDGHPCSRNTAFCYRGVCQTADKQCQRIFGSVAKNGPLACYEEINSQMDRMGHCGSNQHGYQRCAWKDLRCGKLVCEYSSSRPFTKEKAAVMYAQVQNKLCVTLDYMKPPAERDPMLVNDGTVCGDRKICLNQMCVSVAVLNYTCGMKCHNHGVCNNLGDCHCYPGWKPPTCWERVGVTSVSGSSPTGEDVESMGSMKMCLFLIFCLFVPVILALLLLLLKRSGPSCCRTMGVSNDDNLRIQNSVHGDQGTRNVAVQHDGGRHMWHRSWQPHNRILYSNHCKRV